MVLDNTRSRNKTQGAALLEPIEFENVDLNAVDLNTVEFIPGSVLKRLPEESPFSYDIAIIGMGYVGLPTSLAFVESGLRVLGVELSQLRIDAITRGHVDLLASDQDRLTRAQQSGLLHVSSDSALISQAATVIVCVPTPVDAYLVPDLSLLRSACATVVQHAVAEQVLILTSTSYVGSTRDLMMNPLIERGFTPGTDIFIAFSPERINPGAAGYAHEDVPRVVGGATPNCTAAAATIVGGYVNQIHLVSSMETAEMTKLVENIFRAVNIALANEFADVSALLDLDVVEVINAAATKPYGFMPFLPGPGVGGHCIPCDPHYLLWQLHKERRSAPLIEQTMSLIAARPRRVVDRVRELLSTHRRGLTGTRVLVVGVAYKPDVEDVRESPALEVLSALQHEGAIVAYYDPLCPHVRLHDGSLLSSVSDPTEFGSEVAVIHTAHSGVDLGWLDEVEFVLDTSYTASAIAHAVRL
ncbi:nucleotide sugar dehydrogenase [Microterricola viridarii]|uniref:Nucleotide sugar dehydrogenase n=1 Tax=Microterricola viridarii TaxID=412690 RepID=A0A1H1XUP8_9MICO|nr:nucleotide sugar dehydrogenase [Microterricola viridarii]SDT12998.1 nucleotide sugar dehydrogenase [Microterricola viridarii]